MKEKWDKCSSKEYEKECKLYNEFINVFFSLPNVWDLFLSNGYFIELKQVFEKIENSKQEEYIKDYCNKTYDFDVPYNIKNGFMYDINRAKIYHLIGADGKEYDTFIPGTFGGHKRLKIYGRLDCPSALRAIAKGQYVKYRVFFADEQTAISAGYRPCGICMKKEYKEWKLKNSK